MDERWDHKKSHLYPLFDDVVLCVTVYLIGGKICNIRLSLSERASSLADLPLSSREELVGILKGEAIGRVDLSPYTDLMKRVYRETIKIPFGSTRSYGEVAKAVGTHPRAVGQALRMNNTPLIIPCHRVVRKGGDIGGFSQGGKIKEALLRFEHENCSNE